MFTDILYFYITKLGIPLQNGVHSLCPAIWSKHRRWLMMSMMCLNPVACVSLILFYFMNVFQFYSHRLTEENSDCFLYLSSIKVCFRYNTDYLWWPVTGEFCQDRVKQLTPIFWEIFSLYVERINLATVPQLQVLPFFLVA